MRTPHRRDISARQDLIGRELRQLFDDYTHEDMPDELKALAEQLQSAFEVRKDDDPEPTAASGPGSDEVVDGSATSTDKR